MIDSQADTRKFRAASIRKPFLWFCAGAVCATIIFTIWPLLRPKPMKPVMDVLEAQWPAPPDTRVVKQSGHLSCADYPTGLFSERFSLTAYKTLVIDVSEGWEKGNPNIIPTNIVRFYAKHLGETGMGVEEGRGWGWTFGPAGGMDAKGMPTAGTYEERVGRERNCIWVIRARLLPDNLISASLDEIKKDNPQAKKLVEVQVLFFACDFTHHPQSDTGGGAFTVNGSDGPLRWPYGN